MLQRQAWFFTFIICVLIAGTSAHSAETSGQSNESKRLLIAYDSSNSMWGELGDKSRKYEAGRSALSAFLKIDLGDREIGFRAYGHRDKTDCRDSELIVSFAKAEVAKTQINQAAGNIQPTGKTPITYSLRQGLKDFDGGSGDILLISDGIETCDEDPCDLMREWQDSAVNIRVHVVGVGLTDFERQAMACIARVSGGQYFDADSADGFAEALTQASAAIEQPSAPKPADVDQGYSLRIVAIDDQGRSYIAKGMLLQAGAEIGEVGSHRRNALPAPGDYEIELGPVLRDGTIYQPVKQQFSVTEPGETTVQVTVTRPAIVTAKFLEDGEEHHGSHVTAYQDDEKIFGFRAFDEALARPGDYEFRASPNDDNTLSLTESLIKGEHTELVFELITTIQFYVRYTLPNGDQIRRGSELWLDGEKVYSVFSGNPTRVRPGVYELRSDDQNTPLTPTQIEIRTDGETIEVPLDAGFVKISYGPPERDYVGTPNRAWLESIDRGNSKYANLNKAIPAAPGRYKVNPQSSKGFMDSIEIMVRSGETVEAVFTPQPLGEIVVNFAPSGYEKLPDRASVYVLDGQKILNGFMRPGVAKKFLPGRYRVDPKRSDTQPQDIVVKAHETTTVILRYKSDE